MGEGGREEVRESLDLGISFSNYKKSKKKEKKKKPDIWCVCRDTCPTEEQR